MRHTRKALRLRTGLPVPPPDYLALRLHVEAEHPMPGGLYLGLRNDVLDERHAAVCDWTPDTKKPGAPMA